MISTEKTSIKITRLKFRLRFKFPYIEGNLSMGKASKEKAY
ncbi:unnamed protein product [Arabidopsis halleri]